MTLFVYMFGVTETGAFIIPRQPLSTLEFAWKARDFMTGESELHEMWHRPTDKERQAKRIFQVAALLMENAWKEATA